MPRTDVALAELAYSRKDHGLWGLVGLLGETAIFKQRILVVPGLCQKHLNGDQSGGWL